MQLAVRILRQPYESQPSGSPTRGSDLAEASCAGRAAQLLRLAQAILRQSQRTSGSYAKRTKAGLFLTFLATQDVAASTQNQAFNASLSF
jgi:hypothetical protein